MIDAMWRALKVLENKKLRMDEHLIPIVVDELRQAIEQAEQWDTSDMAHRSGGLSFEQAEKQEPVDIHCPSCLHSFSVVPVTKREWVGLTDEEIVEILDFDNPTIRKFAYAIEAKLKERNI
jgi:hypothetical protein